MDENFLFLGGRPQYTEVGVGGSAYLENGYVEGKAGYYWEYLGEGERQRGWRITLSLRYLVDYKLR